MAVNNCGDLKPLHSVQLFYLYVRSVIVGYYMNYFDSMLYVDGATCHSGVDACNTVPNAISAQCNTNLSSLLYALYFLHPCENCLAENCLAENISLDM